ncbi:digestive cysteine proteinase 1 [Hetaerina americana]|uniref:digestive cysteine proteinase 1 n=1 Tax=Hetaerina americana TaxID=62018 RepID=UPI003A7F247C
MSSKYFLLLHLGCILMTVSPVYGYLTNFVVQEDSAPVFSSKYTVKGVLYIPYAEIREPFYGWYDAEAGSSRIDYYGDMVKTYQLSKMGDFGTMRKIVPITTETKVNERSCLEVNGTKESPVSPQSILPDLTGFNCIGSEFINGLDCEKWRLVEKKGEKVNKYTLWIRYKKSPRAPSVMEPVPVRYEMKGFNSLLGSHYDHYYLEYEWYSSESPNPDVFEVTGDLTCQPFPGPGDQHIYTFNPMKEFVHNYDSHVESSFDKFVRTHNKEYNDHTEENHRLNVYRQNMRFITSKNRAGLGFQLGVNHLADRTDDELKALRGRHYSGIYNGGLPFPDVLESEMKDVPPSMDWRLYGAVTPVKDQSVCGSCWSFGTTGAIEGAYFLKYGHLVRLSQQALIDCSWGYGNNGCDGGEDFRSYQWMMKHGGLPSEDEYGPYMGQDGYCHVNSTKLVARITGYVNVTSGNATALKYAVSRHGPISVAIDASHKTFSFYSNGVYYDSECGNKPEQLDHAVLVVGYGDMNGKPYWLVKNSWSNYWGNDGYVLMAQKDNNCGVTTDPTYVLM